MSKKTNLSQGPVLSSLLKFTIPILISILLQTTYGTADLLIVGQFASVGDVSAVTIGSQLMQAVTAFFIGLSMGTTVLIARNIGSKKPELASRVLGVSIALFTAIAFIATILILLLNQQIITIMQTPLEAIVPTKSYLYYTGAGTIFVVLYNLLGSIFRGIGDSKTPLITVFIACIINIALDLILVAMFNLGATGAAIATIVAQAFSVLLSVIMIKNKELPFVFDKSTVKFDIPYIKNILTIGIPVALQGSLVTVSFLFITSIINELGVVASASVGIVLKITTIIMVVPQSFMQSLSAFVAQNIGANKMERATEGLKHSITLSLIFGFIFAYISAFHGTIFVRIFTQDPDITQSALIFLRSYSIDCIFVAILFSFAGFFNGCGKTTFVMLQAVIGAFLIRVPLAYFFSNLENTTLFIIGLATPTSTFFQIIACILYYFNAKKQNSLTNGKMF